MLHGRDILCIKSQVNEGTVGHTSLKGHTFQGVIPTVRIVYRHTLQLMALIILRCVCYNGRLVLFIAYLRGFSLSIGGTEGADAAREGQEGADCGAGAHPEQG